MWLSFDLSKMKIMRRSCENQKFQPSVEYEESGMLCRSAYLAIFVGFKNVYNFCVEFIILNQKNQSNHAILVGFQTIIILAKLVQASGAADPFWSVCRSSGLVWFEVQDLQIRA